MNANFFCEINRRLVVLLTFFSGTFGYCQINSENRQLFQKAYSDLVLFPEKAEKIAEFIVKNPTNKKSLQEAKSILAKSLFYQLNSGDLMMILSEHDFSNTVLRDNLLSTLYIESKNTASKNYKAGFWIANSLGNEQEIFKEINKSISNDAEKFVLRERMIQIIERNLDEDKSQVTDQQIVKLCDLFPNDWDFRLLKIRLLLKEEKLKEAKILLDSAPETEIEDGGNKWLKLNYCKTVSLFYLKKKDIYNYKLAVKKQDETAEELNQFVSQSSIDWYLAKRKMAEQVAEKKYIKDRLIWILLTILGFIIVLVLTLRLLYVKNQNKQFGMFLNRVKFLESKKMITNSIPEKTENIVLEKLKLFENSQEFINPGISLQTLAKKLGTNTKYLSEIINQHKEKNFATYINELRINYIIQKLKDDSAYKNYKIKYLAEESGFSSHSLFASVFKNMIGISPANYIQLLKEKKP